MQPMTVEQALKILWDATYSIHTDGRTHDAMRLAHETLRLATMVKETKEGE